MKDFWIKIQVYYHAYKMGLRFEELHGVWLALDRMANKKKEVGKEPGCFIIYQDRDGNFWDNEFNPLKDPTIVTLKETEDPTI